MDMDCDECGSLMSLPAIRWISDVPDITAEFHLYPVPEQAVSTRLVEGLAYLPSVLGV